MVGDTKAYKCLVERAFNSFSDNGYLWIGKAGEARIFSLINSYDVVAAKSFIGESGVNLLADNLIGVFDRPSNLEALTASLADRMSSYLSVGKFGISIVPAVRFISNKGEGFSDCTGKGLIDELARLQNPGAMDRDLLIKFAQINSFLKFVTGHADAVIEVPHDREVLLVHMDGKVLPLTSLGTGIHEVVMLAAFCTLKEREIVCIEEPEIHLHPRLQRRLIEYLEENTSNQYFIATHSACFIDTPGAAVFHVTNQDGKTKVSLTMDSSAKFDICRDLGYKASDFLQTNAIIWVEGPSDRIYVNHWINGYDSTLREGVDYSIMFYGGRLLSHLRTDDPELVQGDVDSLIAVRRLNRYLAVVIDSDKDCAESRINETKTRIIDELTSEEQTSFAWLTDGREIENYIGDEMMKNALKEVYEKSFHRRHGSGQFDHALSFENKKGEVVDKVDKVKIARAICSKPANLDVLDLRGKIENLVHLIRKANHKE